MAGLVHIQPCAAVCRVELREYDFHPHMLLTGGVSNDEDSAVAGLPCEQDTPKRSSTIVRTKLYVLLKFPFHTVTFAA
jgi:hypothetical protein